MNRKELECNIDTLKMWVLDLEDEIADLKADYESDIETVNTRLTHTRAEMLRGQRKMYKMLDYMNNKVEAILEHFGLEFQSGVVCRDKANEQE